MNKILKFSLLGIFILSITGFIYFYNIGNGKILSSKGEDWAIFGNYFGGVAGPFLSFLSVILLVYTVELQKNQILSLNNEILKKDLLSYIITTDNEINKWLDIKIAVIDDYGETTRFGDIVFGIINFNDKINKKEFAIAVTRLHQITCTYCESIALYRDNINHYFIFKFYYDKAVSILNFLEKHKTILNPLAAPSLDICKKLLDGERD